MILSKGDDRMLTANRPEGELTPLSSRRAVGRLILKDDLCDGERIPLQGVGIEIWVHHLLMPYCLGSGTSDADGHFAIPLSHDHHELTLQVRLSTLDVTYSKAGEAVETPSQFWSQPLDVRCDGVVADLGNLLVESWPYRADYPVPRAGGGFAHLPEKLPWGLLFREGEVGLDMGRHAITYLAMSEASSVPLDTIQSGFVKNRTQDVGPRSRSDEWLGERVLNGHYPVPLARDARDTSRYRLKFRWGDVPCDGAHDLSDVDATFSLEGGVLRPVEIRLAIRRAQASGEWAAPPQWQAFTPRSTQWEQAKRVFRSHYMLAGEIDSHMTMAHMRVEQYSVAVHRSLHQNPVRHLLLPHLSEVVTANLLGDTVAWGPESITCLGTAMKAPLVRSRFARISAGYDWTAWRPRRPLCEEHQFARAANVYWDVLDEYVTRYFDRHLEAIVVHWAEVYRLSRDLVANSLPYVAPEPDEDLVWDDCGERGALDLARVRYDNVLRAVRPITPRESEPTVEDLCSFMAFCKYVIYHATFYHGWVHDRQWDDGGELAYAPQALRNGSLGDEGDARVEPTRREAALYLLTLAVGANTRQGFVMQDGEHDVPPLLRAVLQANAAKFQAVGYNLEQLRSKVNI